MELVERIIVRPGHKDFQYCQNVTHLTKNIHNAALYDIRQEYFNNKKYKTAYDVINSFTKFKNTDMYALPTKVSKQTILQVGKDMKSFFSLVRKKSKGEYDKKVSMPKYKKKDGYALATYPRESISRKVHELPEGNYAVTVCSKDKTFAHTFVFTRPDIVNVRIVPKHHGKYFVVEGVYKQKESNKVPDNGRYASVDFGVNNLMTVFYNFDQPGEVYSGRRIKSYNRFYNKKRSRSSSILKKCNGMYTSKRVTNLTITRECKINNDFHHITRWFANQAVFLGVSKVIVGYNKEWKQDAHLGKRNNQNFVGIPFYKLLSMLKYKLEMEGIELIVTEESYTSKCSALDKEPLEKKGSYCGARKHRGLFVTEAGKRINADMNGAINIMRKVIPEELIYFDGIEEIAVSPIKIKL